MHHAHGPPVLNYLTTQVFEGVGRANLKAGKRQHTTGPTLWYGILKYWLAYFSGTLCPHVTLATIGALRNLYSECNLNTSLDLPVCCNKSYLLQVKNTWKILMLQWISQVLVYNIQYHGLDTGATTIPKCSRVPMTLIFMELLLMSLVNLSTSLNKRNHQILGL